MLARNRDKIVAIAGLAIGLGLAVSCAFAQSTGAPAPAADPLEPVGQAWVGWGVNYLCARDGYVLSSWLNWVWEILAIPVLAQLVRNLRVIWPGLDGVKVLQWLALHFVNAQPAGTVTIDTVTVTQTKP